jgi:hypothetical protein
MLRALLLGCILAMAPVTAGAQADSAPTRMPDVLVLVLSGVGPVDQVSINYSSTVAEQTVKADIRALAKDTAWLVDSEKVTSRTVAGKKTTSGSFNTLATVNYKEGILSVAPFVTVFRRYPSIEVNYLVPERFRFHGLKDFENEFVKLHLEQRGSSYLYRIRVKDSHFDRLVLPTRQPQPRTKEVHGLSTGGRVVCVVIFALLCALGAYFGARAICRRRGAG